MRTAVANAAAKRNKIKTNGTYRVAMVTAETARVWRLT